MKLIKLITREELKIYMNPVRQQLLRQLSISSGAMTPKQLADKLCISPSSVQHHIKKLMKLELIELDHQEQINGITANFYRAAKVTVQVGLEKEDDTYQQRDVLLQESVAGVYDGFRTKVKNLKEHQAVTNMINTRRWGDILTGVLHLRKEDSDELFRIMYEYIDQHSLPNSETDPWEYALILYNAKEDIFE